MWLWKNRKTKKWIEKNSGSVQLFTLINKSFNRFLKFFRSKKKLGNFFSYPLKIEEEKVLLIQFRKKIFSESKTAR